MILMECMVTNTSFSLLIAAAAELAGLTVLHVDKGFDLIATMNATASSTIASIDAGSATCRWVPSGAGGRAGCDFSALGSNLDVPSGAGRLA